jgi:hypothetical protein
MFTPIGPWRPVIVMLAIFTQTNQQRVVHSEAAQRKPRNVNAR